MWILTLAVLGTLLTALYAPVVDGMLLQWWDDPNYSHGFIVPVFSAFLLWQDREHLKRVEIAGNSIGLLVLLFGVGILILGIVGAELFLMRSSLLIVLTGLILFHAGWPLLRAVTFPLAFLVFMIPLPAIVFNAIAFPLQGLAASNATWTLYTLGIPVLQDGNVIHLPEITLGVTEACSGIRSLISLLALAVVWAHIAIPGLLAKTAFIIAAIPITIIANAGRIVLTGLVGRYLGIEYAQGFFHGFSGWVIFVVAAVLLFAVHTLLEAILRLRRGPTRPQ